MLYSKGMGQGPGRESTPTRHGRSPRLASRSPSSSTSRTIATTDRGLALTHNLGGYPGEMVSFVSVVGTQLG